MRKMSNVLFWFRRDLRVEDNVGFYHAAKSGTVIPVYLVDPTHDHWPHRCGDRLHFKLQCVASLREDIRSRVGELYVRIGHPSELLPELADRLNAGAVFWNRCYEPYEIERDEMARASLQRTGVDVHTYKDQVMFEEREILTEEGSPYQVYTYYAKKWKEREKPKSVSDVSNPGAVAEVDSGDIPDVAELGLERRLSSLNWEPDRSSAIDRFDAFLTNSIQRYHEDRDYPAREGTSGMSPYLRFGLVSVRELYELCFEHRTDPENPGIDTYIEELIWRDFYHQILFHFPNVVHQNFRSKYDDLAWEDHPDWFDAWKCGRTGFPIVDAAMRQLNTTGWMHNRLRMIVAQFLTKHCLIHWKKGERYFMNRLIDGDTAANNGGWQWSASTGTDAAPYFRMFNPIAQSEEYDPDGAFIQSYCPELADLPDDLIHAPFDADSDRLAESGVKLGESYPEPLFDHRVRRNHAIEVFKG